jgi:hypothetical protein
MNDRRMAGDIVGVVREPPGWCVPRAVCLTTGRFTNRPYDIVED